MLLVLQPVADKAQLSSAIITDTLAALPVSPQAVSHVQGPILEVHQVDMPLKVSTFIITGLGILLTFKSMEAALHCFMAWAAVDCCKSEPWFHLHAQACPRSPKLALYACMHACIIHTESKPP